MPALEPRRRPRAVYEEDDGVEPSPATSDSSKRRKGTTYGHASEEELELGGREIEEEEGEEEEEEEEEREGKGKGRRKREIGLCIFGV